MSNVEEIALRVNRSMDKRDAVGNFEAFCIRFAKALLAELSKDAVPVNWKHLIEWWESGSEDWKAFQEVVKKTFAKTHPANTKEIENRVAEAIAKMCDDQAKTFGLENCGWNLEQNMTTHTKEPWEEFCEVCESSTPNPESEPIVRLSFDDYVRARACVNACAGIDIDALEIIHSNGPYPESDLWMRHRAVQAVAKFKEAEKQRDDLLAVATEIKDWLLSPGEGCLSDSTLAKLLEAIAAVKDKK